MTASTETFEGPITVTRTGKGFFSYDPEKDDLFIPDQNLNGAFPGDIVKVAIAGKEPDSRTGQPREVGVVQSIVKRSRTTFVGVLVSGNEINQNPADTYLIPDWKKMYTPFLVRGESLPKGQKVLVRFTDWAEGERFPQAVLEEIIGPAGVHETEMRALALGSGFRPDFPPGVVHEAEALEKTGQAALATEVIDAIASGARRDFRTVTTFTIDPFDAKDFDDALSVRKLENGNTEVGVHIADVSFYVRPGTSIDDEARARATSVYLVDRTIPMLPEVLSNGLCSLNPNEDRLAVSAVFEIDNQAGIVSRWFGETVIHSDKRFTYENAQEVLDNKSGEYLEELTTLETLANLIRARRVAKGAIAFDTPEVKIELNAEGKPIAVHLKERKATNLLIEDFMLLANEEVAEYLTQQAKKAGLKETPIYRTHDVPDADRILNLAAFLKVLGYHLNESGGHVTGKDINLLLSQVIGKPEEYLIKVAALRSMSKAIYTTKNIGHFGLAFEFYTHFTSPIRRYPDLLIHRMVKHFADREPLTKAEMQEFDALALHSSEREVSAAEAERDSIKMKQVEYLETRVGEEFDAVISGVTDRGMYVELKETRAEGMVAMRNIGNDYFTYDQKRYRLIGERTKVQYALGDPVRVKLLAARVAEKELDFGLVVK
ncbi:MAG: ribonuclease R [Candidatus Paceibacterota bacterium]